MKTTIIFSHPWHGSFNKVILDKVMQTLKEQNREFTVIDLYKDNFDPRMSEESLALFSQGGTTDPLVEQYKNILKQTEKLIIISPIWWYDFPAILKGFIEKVFLKNFAYAPTRTGLRGLLSNIEETLIITTSDGPKWYVKLSKGTLFNAMNKKTFKDVGVKKVKWINKGMVTSKNNQKRNKFLENLHKYI